MDMTFEINMIAILFVAELLLVLTGLSIFLSMRVMRKPVGRVKKTAASIPESADDEAIRSAGTGWLEAEIEKIHESLYALNDEESLDKAKTHWKALLELREGLLESELKAALQADERPVWRSILDEAYRPLMLPPAKDEAESVAPSSVAVEAVTRSEEEIARLRAIIDEQHGMVGTLKKELAEFGEDSEHWKTVVNRVDHVSHQGEKLSRCANVLEFHNSRIISRPDGEEEDKVEPEGQVEIAAGADEQPEPAPSAADDAEDLYGLKTLIGDQQATISKLRGMLDELVPEAERGAELATMLDGIQRSNSELIGCVAILETENERLTEQVDELRTQLGDSGAEPELPPAEELKSA